MLTHWEMVYLRRVSSVESCVPRMLTCGVRLVGCLAEALETLHNLRFFHWYGGYPPPKPIVLGTLARSVGGSALSDLRLP